MPDFSKTFKLLLDADTRGAVDGLGKFSDAARRTETSATGASRGVSGAIGDIVAKTGLGQKAMSTFGVSAGQMGTAVTGAALAGGVAVAKFALDGAAHFGALGESVEKFSKVAGVSAETASRFIAVADDYGVSADTISTAVGKLGKTLGANVDALAKYGVAVAKGKDGNTDLAATTFNVIDAYNKTQDPAKKAALATAAFGKGYQDLIPLIDEGSQKIKASFDDVSKAQLFDDSKVKAAKDYRLAMDDLHDTLTDLQMTIGTQLVPVIIEVGNAAKGTIGPLNDLSAALPIGTVNGLTKAFLGLLDPIKGYNELVKITQDRIIDPTKELLGGGKFGIAESAMNSLAGAVHGTAGAIVDAVAANAAQASATDKAASAAQAATRFTKNYADEQQRLEDHAKRAADSLNAQVGAVNAQRTAMRAAADATFAVADATDTFAKFSGDLATKLGAAKGNQDDINAIYREGTKDAAALADAVVRVGEEHATAAGTVFDATQKQDSWNREMLFSAMNAVPAQRKAILGYIAEANGIPESKTTDIEALIAQGKFEEAAAALATLSKSREASVVAVADEASLKRTADQLEILTRNRTVNVDIVAKGGAGYGGATKTDPLAGLIGVRDAGGPVKKGMPYLIGLNRQAELFVPEESGMVIPLTAGGIPRTTMPVGAATRPDVTGPISVDPVTAITGDMTAARKLARGRPDVTGTIDASQSAVATRLGPVWQDPNTGVYPGSAGRPKAWTTVEPEGSALRAHRIDENYVDTGPSVASPEGLARLSRHSTPLPSLAGSRTGDERTGHTYNININVPPGADLAAVGKAAVEAIKVYERSNGARWRAA